MEENWLKKMSQEQLEAMFQDVQNEIESRQIVKREKAWAKVESAIMDFLEIKGTNIKITTLDNQIIFNQDNNIDLEAIGCIEICAW